MVSLLHIVDYKHKIKKKHEVLKNIKPTVPWFDTLESGTGHISISFLWYCCLHKHTIVMPSRDGTRENGFWNICVDASGRVSTHFLWSNRPMVKHFSYCNIITAPSWCLAPWDAVRRTDWRALLTFMTSGHLWDGEVIWQAVVSRTVL